MTVFRKALIGAAGAVSGSGGGGGSGSYDITTASPASAFTASGDVQATAFSPDGTVCLYINTVTDDLYRLDLSTPFDLTTDSANGQQAFPSLSSNAYGLSVKPDGTRVYTIDSDFNAYTVRGYSMSTAWDVSTLSLESSFDISADVSNNAQGVCVAKSGTKMYIATYASSVVEYDLGTAWEVSTASKVQTLSIGTAYDLRDLDFNADGTRFGATDSGNDQAVQFDLSTAWDISTASANGTYDFSADQTFPLGFTYGDSGNLMAVSGASPNEINAYTLT